MLSIKLILCASLVCRVTPANQSFWASVENNIVSEDKYCKMYVIPCKILEMFKLVTFLERNLRNCNLNVVRSFIFKYCAKNTMPRFKSGLPVTFLFRLTALPQRASFCRSCFQLLDQ